MMVPIGASRAGVEERDLRSLIHLLVAGTTGGGKSNFLHCLLVHLAQYDYVKLFIIDLKRMEFECYKNHAILAYRTKQAYKVLRYLRDELDRRMDLLAAAGVKNIKNYKGKLDYFVLVVDEFSQLSPALATDKEEKDLRKTCHQMLVDIVCLARAVGIHAIVATQRPDADILPGQFKANLPATMCFKVKNVTNSMICLDNTRAASLPADLPGRAIFQFDVEREVQAYWMGDYPERFLPKVPKTKPLLEENNTDIEPC